MERIPWMHNLTPGEIGIDYDVLSKLVPLEHFIKHHSLEAILDAAAWLYGVKSVREWLTRHDKPSSSPGDSSPLPR